MAEEGATAGSGVPPVVEREDAPVHGGQKSRDENAWKNMEASWVLLFSATAVVEREDAPVHGGQK